MNEKNKIITEQLTAQLKAQKWALERAIENYKKIYYDYLYAVIYANELTGIITRKKDGVTGRLTVIERRESFVFYEPYVIYFVPEEKHIPREAVYKVSDIFKNYVK